MTVRAMTIGNVTYNVAQAPAIEQKKLLLLIGSLIGQRAAASGAGIDPTLVFGVLISLPEQKFDEIARIVLYKTMVHGETTVTDIGMFQGKVTDYFMLVANAVAYNLDDFFVFLVSEKLSGAKREQTK